MGHALAGVQCSHAFPLKFRITLTHPPCAAVLFVPADWFPVDLPILTQQPQGLWKWICCWLFSCESRQAAPAPRGLFKAGSSRSPSTPSSFCWHMCAPAAAAARFNDCFHRVAEMSWGAQAMEGKWWFSAIYNGSRLEWHFTEKPKAIVSRY